MRSLHALVLLLCAAPVAACTSPRPMRGEEGPPRAVVVSAVEEEALSDRIARTLNAHGYDVVRKSTPLARAHSSMAIYDVRGHAERVDELTAILKDEIGLDVEVLPFMQHATGGNVVVIWLAPGATSSK